MKKNFRKRKKGVILVVVCFISMKVFAIETKIIISPLKIKNNHLYMNLELISPFTPEVEEIFPSGIEVKIKIIIEVMKKPVYFFFIDKREKKISMECRIKYDLLEKKYIIYNNRGGEYRLKELQEVIETIRKYEDIKVISTLKLKKENYYYIKVKAEIKSIELYPPLANIIDIFTPFWNYKTEWTRTSLFPGFK